MKLTVLAITLATIAPCFAVPQAVPGLTKRETCTELKRQRNNICSKLVDPCGTVHQSSFLLLSPIIKEKSFADR
ncbi:hypothetical protein MBM_03364 [Drepanopeziza brunnea f. sp. 'multigermtubi' MB_m1]|uniref:Uncharacterized protein n=1 Tax=Marssonina brunnea f. sp. multigermtubi (strain MB_m1) TaxID=1072389 RepID=K1WZE5_MARBU|nr:uncharacterized protein MBM_03364 [Drepanopeziza brunnea f. sp. 'multigermtubi' MB_m1]EKD18371.1 hypothetical protein MBM_03364 [Drepanopeziza brunnea f. sp. 'multigermtubi' MB_m1]